MGYDKKARIERFDIITCIIKNVHPFFKKTTFKNSTITHADCGLVFSVKLLFSLIITSLSYRNPLILIVEVT